MTRDELFALAAKSGHRPGQPLATPKRKAIEGALRAYFATSDGQRDLEDAPREHIAERGEDKFRRVTAERAIDLLMEELAFAPRQQGARETGPEAFS